MKREMLWKQEGFDAAACSDFCEGYKKFISDNKTEREAVAGVIAELKEKGAVSLDEVLEKGMKPEPNQLIYADMMKKSLMIFRMGTAPLTEGLRILGAHVDSPRLDIKQNPLYEDHEMAYLDTHYYGGVKKYQWLTIPLSIHGVVAKKDGTVVNVVIGEDESDPVLGITDLLPHLGKSQMGKKAGEFVSGEALNLLIASTPLKGEEKDAVKANVLAIIKEKYGFEEEDFLSAELEVVPAGRARDYGLDRSMVLGYGQDDRVCAYTSYKALLDQENPVYTTACLFADKEEIGSVGATGMTGTYFADAVRELLEACGCASETALHRIFKKSKVLSSDVSAGFDPLFPEVMESKNSCYLGYGPVFNKFTGSGGKFGSNDANAEYIAFLRAAMEKGKVSFQTAELGKVEEGGGGTIAYILAELGCEVIDFGVAVLSMHSPHEVTSKADVYEAYRAYRAFIVG